MTVASPSSSTQGAVLATLLFALGLAVGYTMQQRTGAVVGVPPPLLPRTATPPAAAADRFHQAPCPPPRQPGTPRRNLVFAAVGDKWSPDKWMFSEQSSWDLVAVYYGNRTDWSCPQCTLALRMPDSMKWQMVWRLMTAGGSRKDGEWAGVWDRLRRSYDYVMVTDDDLVMDSCTIDIFFQSMRRNQLLVAQPSNCRGSDSDNPYWVHWQLPGLELHHVNLVEVTAPGLDMTFLDTKVRPYLEHTFSGWGLPFCFWAAAGFAQKKLAAIDAACMIHPARRDVGEKMLVSERIRRGLVKPGSIYARFAELTPFSSPKEEQNAVWKECGFTDPTARGNRPLIFGTVLAAPQATAAEAGQALTVDTAAAAEQQQQQQQHLAAVKMRQGQVWQEPVVLLGMLALAAGAGAAAALRWARRLQGHQAAAAGRSRSRSLSASPLRV